MYLAIDTGGTFTDFVLSEKGRDILTFKVPSTPKAPASAVLDGLERLSSEYGFSSSSVDGIVFGTTIATNAIIERKGAHTALLTTRGARDVLEIQRLWRPRLFDLYIQKIPPLVPRRWRYEVNERVGADGQIVEALDADSTLDLLERLQTENFDAVAVCLLFSFLHPEHEETLKKHLQESLPGVDLSISSEVSPQFREYERTSTTVVNAYVMPPIRRLVDQLETGIEKLAFRASLQVMQSNGGLMGTEETRRFPVRTLLSGPAGGVVGAVEIAKSSGLDNVIAMDMGGTSLDISLCQNRELVLTTEGGIAGFPVQVPQVDVHTIGAGGGSIAEVVRGGLKVGPDSAGADPGPACYGQGGERPTSTDAAVILGMIDTDYFAGGDMRLKADLAFSAMERHVAAPLGLSVAEAAAAVVRVQVANMVNGIRAVSVERGLDARGFTLIPFGGAGGLYAGLVAEEMGISQILFPVHSSVLSALGMLMTGLKYTSSRTLLTFENDAHSDLFKRVFDELTAEVHGLMRNEGIEPESVSLTLHCDARYRGQAYEIPVQCEPPFDTSRIVQDFHDQHRVTYGHSDPGESVEFVTFHVVAVESGSRFSLLRIKDNAGRKEPGRHRSLFFGVRYVDVPVYARNQLVSGQKLDGPAVVEEKTTTTIIYPGHSAIRDEFGNLLVTTPEGGHCGKD